MKADQAIAFASTFNIQAPPVNRDFMKVDRRGQTLEFAGNRLPFHGTIAL